MTVEHVEVLVEEQSMEAALEVILPQLLGVVTFKIHPHQGKPHLLATLPGKLEGYAMWLPASYRILVIVDRDADDCGELKRDLDSIALDAGWGERTSAKRPARRRRKVRPAVVNRLAIEELEAWYFGDWQAVRRAYPRVNKNVPSKAKYRDPDAITGGTWEAFERVLNEAGYFKTGLRKIEAARSVAKHMVPHRNSSHSFQVLRTSLLEMVPT